MALGQKYSDLRLLFFPCNQFCSEEPGSAGEIAAFYCGRHGLPPASLMERNDVNGPQTQDVYKFLRSADGGAPIAWNFTKCGAPRPSRILFLLHLPQLRTHRFVIDKDGGRPRETSRRRRDRGDGTLDRSFARPRRPGPRALRPGGPALVLRRAPAGVDGHGPRKLVRTIYASREPARDERAAGPSARAPKSKPPPASAQRRPCAIR